MKRNFDDIIANLKESIADFGYYVDFNKVYENMDNNSWLHTYFSL